MIFLCQHETLGKTLLHLPIMRTVKRDEHFIAMLRSLQVNPSDTKLFWMHTLYQRGGGHIGSPTISSTLGCTSVKFCKVLEILFKVSENSRFSKSFSTATMATV